MGVRNRIMRKPKSTSMPALQMRREGGREGEREAGRQAGRQAGKGSMLGTLLPC